MKQPTDNFDTLVEIMHQLRKPGGCPWDAEQTHESLKPYLIEEAYEVLEAIEGGSDTEVCEELGDLLLQVVFHAELAAERGAFSINDVAAAISEKLRRRHPHVFGNLKVTSTAEVRANWSRIKTQEKREKLQASDDGDNGKHVSVLDGVPVALPALLKAHRVGQKAAEATFDWPSPEAAKAKVDEEMAEVEEAVACGDGEAIAAELGDLLFALSSYIRLLGFNSETILQETLDRFRRRFQTMEAELAKAGIDIHDAGPEEMEKGWQKAKLSESA